MKYETKKEDITGLAQALGIEVTEKGEEIFFRTCPYCGGGLRRDKDTLSVNWKSGAFKCFRSGCGKTGHFVELARDMGYQLTKEVQLYRNLPQPKDKLKPTEMVYGYLQGKRHLDRDVIDRFEVTAHKTSKDLIVFPFFNEFGKLVFVKYRNLNPTKKDGSKAPKEWCEKDCEPVLFGMNQATNYEEPLIITEGQIDSLSVASAGFENATSVPIGCNGFTWIQNCWDWLRRFKTVIVFGDNEHGKITLVEDIRARFPAGITIKAVRSIDYLGEKDANDILVNFGKDAIRTAIANAEEPEIPRLKEMADVKTVDLNSLEKIKTEIEEIDKVIGGFCMGQVILLTGKRGEGKSTLASQFGCAALDQGRRLMIYSGELADFWVQNWLDTQLAGSSYLTETINDVGRKVWTVEPDALEPIHEWYRGRCFIYDNTQAEMNTPEKEMETLLTTVEQAVVQKGIEMVIVDNLMTAMDGASSTDGLYMQQSNFVGQLKRLAMKYKIVVLLLTHPRKQGQGENKSKMLDNDDVSGSADITNKVDVVLSYGRATNKPGVDSLLQVMKNRLYGEIRKDKDAIELKFSEKTKRVFSARSRMPVHYGWEKTNKKEEKQDGTSNIFDELNELDELPF